MPLTDTQIRKAKPNGKVQKLNDGDGLRLEISKAGTKAFKYRIQSNGKDTNITLGVYPALSLSDARLKRDEVKAMVKQGIDPIQAKKQDKAEQKAQEQAQNHRLTFTQLFEQWHKHNEQSWTYKYSVDINNRITQHLLPVLGDLYIDEIKPQQIIHALKLMEISYRGSYLKHKAFLIT